MWSVTTLVRTVTGSCGSAEMVRVYYMKYCGLAFEGAFPEYQHAGTLGSGCAHNSFCPGN